MNFVQILATLRKLGNYIAGLFPILAVFADWCKAKLARFSDAIGLSALLQRAAETPAVSAVVKVAERFYWRNYSKDRIDLEEASQDSLEIMRPILQLCIVLCLLIPLTQFKIWPVNIEAFSGFKGIAPGWSVVLWLLALPTAWAALLFGAARSNRAALTAAGMGAAYFLSTCVVALPRSYWNLFLSAAVYLALFIGMRIHQATSKTDFLKSISAAMLIGVPTGIQLFCTTPLKPTVGRLIPLPYDQVGIIAGAAIGCLLGILIVIAARVFKSPIVPWKNALGLLCLLLAYESSALARSDLSQAGSLNYSSLSLSNAYLWPVWYLLGVGIIFKLIGSSKVVANAVVSLFPPLLLRAVLLSSLSLALLVAVSEPALQYWNPLNGPVPGLITAFFLFFYRLSAGVIWNQPLNAMTAHWFTWVLLSIAAVLLIMAIQRRLTDAALAKLFYLACLGALLIWEYTFQLSSFSRTPTHSVIALFLFGAWLLWLMHTVGWTMSVRSSPMFPSAGRLPLFGAILLFCLLEIHARAAIADFRIMNEVFLAMFRGVIDVGLPYFLYVYVSRRLPQLPVAVSALFIAFVAGALVSLPLNILDKLAAANWSIDGFNAIVQMQTKSLLQYGHPNIDLFLSNFWLAMRAACYALILFAVALAVRSKSAAVFILVAFASGTTAFSRSMIELGLPGELRGLLAPITQELTFNVNVLFSYLAYNLPALMIGAAKLLATKARTFWLILATACGALLQFSIFLANQRYDVFLRASGMIYDALLLLVCIFLILTALLLQKLGPTEPLDEEQPLLPAPMLMRVLISLVIGFSALSCWQLAFWKTHKENVKSISQSIVVPARWNLSMNSEQLSSLSAKEHDASTSVIMIGKLPTDPNGPTELLKSVLRKAAMSGDFKDLQLVKVESWNKYRDSALACSFSFQRKENRTDVPTAGLTVLIPAGAQTEYFTLFCSPSEIERNQWQLAYIISARK
jgi:hypothetical protein